MLGDLLGLNKTENARKSMNNFFESTSDLDIFYYFIRCIGFSKYCFCIYHRNYLYVKIHFLRDLLTQSKFTMVDKQVLN